MKTVITYGTFDLFHIGHVRILKKLKSLGDRLIVGVSTDTFNALKNKTSLFTYEQRTEIVASIKYVDLVIPENTWEQKFEDIRKYNVDIFAMGNDWKGKFDELNTICEVLYLPRTKDVSSTEIKTMLKGLSQNQIMQMKTALDILQSLAKDLEG